jgi:uncharacterized protein (DUF2237 family)
VLWSDEKEPLTFRSLAVAKNVAGRAPAVILEATQVHALEFISLEDLRAHAARGNEG